MTGFVLQVHIYAFFLSKSQQRPSMRNIYCQTYPTIIQSQQWAFTSESTILHTYSNRVFWRGG